MRATWCVNEGGGDRIELGGKVLYLCATSEKATSPFRLRVSGRSGHASMPAVGDNALVKAARLIDRLARLETEIMLMPETRAFLEAVLGDVPAPADALARLSKLGARPGAMLEPMLRATVSPTQIAASHTQNVSPGSCAGGGHGGPRPGVGQARVEAVIRDALGEGDYELEWLEHVGGSRSSFDTPLRAALESFIAGEEPGAALVPTLLAGFTDSHYLREAFGTVAYGFFPMRAMAPDLAASLVHSADERVPVDDLELGTRCLIHVARELAG